MITAPIHRVRLICHHMMIPLMPQKTMAIAIVSTASDQNDRPFYVGDWPCDEIDSRGQFHGVTVTSIRLVSEIQVLFRRIENGEVRSLRGSIFTSMLKYSIGRETSPRLVDPEFGPGICWNPWSSVRQMQDFFRSHTDSVILCLAAQSWKFCMFHWWCH
jgi:hypothetical protein